MFDKMLWRVIITNKVPSWSDTAEGPQEVIYQLSIIFFTTKQQPSVDNPRVKLKLEEDNKSKQKR
jgi:hypothetical protein